MSAPEVKLGMLFFFTVAGVHLARLFEVPFV